MKATSKTLAAIAALCVAAAPTPSLAETVTSDAALAAAKGWVNLREAPGAVFDASAIPANVAAYAGEGGTGTYYVVSFEGGGYVATSGDTALTPVLAFSRKGTFDADPENPRVKMLRFAAAAESPSPATASANAAKWARLRAAATTAASGSRRLAAASRPSGGVICVSPMLKTSWSQYGTYGENYYDPYNLINSGANAPCGCVATAGAQLMYYWKWPSGTNVVAAGGFYASINTSSGNLGWNAYDGYQASASSEAKTPWYPAFGGPYDWANMKTTSAATTATEKKAVGRLTRDVGIATYMTWSSDAGSSPGSIFGHRLVDTFAYANAKIIGGWNENSRDAMLASLDAGMPCFVNLSNHAVVADGYGYAADGTLYVHYNYGWGNIGDEGDSDDTWYTMEVGSPAVSIVSIAYNVYPPSVGAPDLTVVSGIVSNGTAVAANAVVTATERVTGFTTNVTATSAGRYFFMLPQGCYTFAASSSDGAKTATCAREVKVCVSAIAAGASTSLSYGGSSGNIHGLNFALAAPTAVTPALAHRWSFASDYSDSEGGPDATAVGSVAVKDGQAVLSGNGHGAGYINLGTDLLNTTASTLEIWVSHDAIKNWSRVFDYGSSTSDYFMFAWTYESQLVRDAVGGKVGDSGGNVEDTMAPYELGVKYHIAVTFERQPDGSTFIRWMRRDADTGLLQKQGSMILAGGIQSYVAPSLYLGYSQFTGDSDANASYDEVRVWDGVLSDAVLASHAKAGPDEESPSATVASSVARYVATAMWQGGTAAPTAAALETASNWSVTYSDGTTGNAVPGEKTTVVIPSGATAFTIPSGYTPNWKALQLGTPGSAAQWGVISGASINANTFKDTALTSYTLKGDGDPAYLGHTIIHNPTKQWPSELKSSLIRYDGWINVPAAQAGTWFFRQDIDDYLALVIDGSYVLVDRCCVTSKAAVEMTPGWHRFAYIVGDGSGEYWGRAFPSDHSVATPLVVSVNGGPEYAFGDRHFTLGSSAVAAVTLSADCDWRGVGTVIATVPVDLNGHTLKVDSLDGAALGVKLSNSNASVTSHVSGTVDAGNVSVEGNVLITAGLAHRWTFNSDFTDSVGGSDAVTMKNDTATTSVVGGTAYISGGKAVLTGGDKAGYLNLGAGVLGKDNATLEFWATRTAEQNFWVYLATYGIPESSSGDFVTMAVSCGSGDAARHGKLQGKFGDSSIFVGMPKGVLYHVSATFTKNANGSTTIRWMIRDGKTGFILSETSKTASNWTLADAAEAGWMLTLGNNPYDNNWSDLACEFDDVRVWHGVLSDEQLLLNAVAGPNAPGGGEGDVIVLGGTVAASTPGGYGFSTDSQVMIASGAKIVFDTANYNGTALRFKTGGFILPSGVSSVLDLVELTDAENFTATTEDGGNTIKVALKSTMPLTSVWKGGTPSTAADLANAANWESTNADGTTISAAPGSRTTVIIPANKLAAFTIPSDVTASLGWGRVLLGGYTVTTIGNKAAAPNPRISEYRDYALSQYTVLSETGIDYANGNDTAFQNSYLANKQLRFDGWVYVDETQAGRWNLASSFDDVLSFAIDGKWIFLRPKWEPAMTAGCFVSAGWHRFTLVEADTGGGKGCNDTISGTKVPFSISINGGAAVAFHSAFTFGTEAPSVTFDADRNWAAMGPVTFENGLTIDLNGQNLTLAGGTSDYVGAKIVNSNTSTASTIYTYSGTIDTSLTSGSAGTVNVSSVPPVEAYWTGAGGTGLANDHRNWNCYSAANKSGLLPGALPMSSTLVTMDTDPVGAVVDGDVLKWNQMRLGNANSGKGYLAIEEGGSLSTVSWGTIGQVKNCYGQIDQTGGSFNVGNDFTVGEYGTGVYNQSGGKLYCTGILYIGRNNDNGVGDGTYNLSGGTLETSGSGELPIGNNGNGTFNQTAGNVKVGNWISIGRRAGTGVYNISGGTLTTTKKGCPVWIGGDKSSGVGTLNISGTAVLNLAGGIDAGRSYSSHGYINQDGGSLTIGEANEGFNIARDSYATYVQNAGDLVVNCVTRLAWGNGSNVGGTYKLNGGTATFKNDFYVGVGRLGTFAQSGGTMTANNGVKIANGSSATGYFNMSGGILNTPSIQGVSGVASVVLDGGTIVAKNASDGAFFSGIDSLVVGGGAIDTDGHDLSVTADAVRVIDGGKAFTKAGEGTLTFPAMPASDTVTVEAGVLALAAGANNVAPAAPALTGPTHRWSFNNSYNDSVTGAAPASRFGTTSGTTTPLTITPGKLVLNGGGGWGNGSLSLGVSSLGSADATVEIWAGNDAIVNNSVLFSYSDQNWGTAPKNEVCFKWSEGTAATDVMWVKKAGTDIFKENAVLSQVVLGKEYYFAFTFHDNGDGSTLISWQRRDAATGALERSGRRVVPGWTLANVASSTNPTFAIGVYKNNAAGDAKASYNEVRVWGAALSDDALALSAQKGPDATAADIAAIVAKNGEVADRTLAVASGATLDLGGNALAQPVIAGAGTVQNGTLTVTKKICMNAGEKLTFSGVALDVTGTTVEVADPENLTQPFVFAESTTAIMGKPSVGMKGWTVQKSADGKALTIRRSPGTVVIMH